MIKERFSEVSIVNLPPMRVASFRAISRTPEDDALKVLTQWAAGAGLSGPYRSFGFDCEVTAEQQAAGVRGYELWFVVPASVVASGPVEIQDFSGGRFAAMTIYDPFADPFAHIPAGWDMLHNWAVDNSYGEPWAMPCLEEVIEHDGAVDMVIYYRIGE